MPPDMANRSASSPEPPADAVPCYAFKSETDTESSRPLSDPGRQGVGTVWVARCRSASHANARPVSATGTSEPRFSNAQPCVVTSAPEANEVNAMVVNTQKLMAACARSFSSGL